MTGHPIRRTVAVLCAAALTASLGSATATLGADDLEPAGAKRLIRCDGKVATKIGTKSADVILGTAKRDIVAGLEGNDVILGRGGNDLICGGAGHDRLVGGSGHDKLLGQTGRDRLLGGGGLDGYSTRDVMIAKLVESSGDGKPGGLDTIVTGRYPTNLDGSTFAFFGKHEHEVKHADARCDQITALAPNGAWFEWRNLTGTFSLQHYKEARSSEDDGHSVLFDNRYYIDGVERDTIRTESTSPSAPQGVDLHLFVVNQPTDEAFLDVEIVYQEP